MKDKSWELKFRRVVKSMIPLQWMYSSSKVSAKKTLKKTVGTVQQQHGELSAFPRIKARIPVSQVDPTGLPAINTTEGKIRNYYFMTTFLNDIQFHVRREVLTIPQENIFIPLFLLSPEKIQIACFWSYCDCSCKTARFQHQARTPIIPR